MTTPLTDMPLITPWIIELTECVCVSLAEFGAGPTCRCSVLPGGNIAYEGCLECDNSACGMAWLRVASAFPYETFPTPSADPSCRRDLAWEMEIGCVRCMPQSNDGTPLDAEVMSETWVSQMLDSQAIVRAALCCDLPAVALGVYQPVGPEGGCVGGFWTVYIASY